MLRYTVFKFTLLLSVCYGYIDIGKYLKVCDRNSADVNDCIAEAVQNGLAVLADGITELGVPPVDPYRQKDLHAEYNNNQITAKMDMKDIYVHGLKSSEIKDARLRADDDQFYLEVDLTTPKVFVTGQYQGEGRYNSLKIAAKGSFNSTMTDLVYTWKLEGVPEKKDNETYMRIKSFYMRPDVGNMVSYLSNDNPESRELVDIGNRFINSNNNWRLMYRELLPLAQANWNKIGVRIANKIFLKIPYNQLFPALS
ncbi:uncharacterized protein LOC113518150 [Galleria mellonella]|uniref:Uncharacterized protein LOC113518150 n=1 Tax=Galleria mellonella TaxID=7137 RepID=A0A6J1WSS7_GALME|nr:uncharacterized protein LOC113518150 [Galleria mellonella]